MEQNRFDIIRERLNSIKEVTAGVENFTHKQTELFEALNNKFPSIEQFSNALRDANELLMFAEGIQSDIDICLQHLEQLQNAYVLEIQQYSKITEIKKTLNDISSELDGVSDIDTMRKELLKVASK
ncbi:MAG: hypothetical protein LBT96_03500 [Campylobacteraceae bacterium]|jgi:predicted component of type VI protein secretion system|nr:hypothetical protein [Campylobacteraceae bacterium]